MDNVSCIMIPWIVPLTYLPLEDKMTVISQKIFSDAFLWMQSFVFWLTFLWSLFLKVQLKITQHWFEKWLDAEKATSHYLNQCWPSSLTHICGTRGRWAHFTYAVTPNKSYLLSIVEVTSGFYCVVNLLCHYMPPEWTPMYDTDIYT